MSLYQLNSKNNCPVFLYCIHHSTSPPPQKIYITFVFHFSWVLQPSQEKLKTMLMQTFGGQIRCIMGNVEVVYMLWFKFILGWNFLLFCFSGMVMYDYNMIMSLKQKKRKFEPRIKLNHNIYPIFRRWNCFLSSVAREIFKKRFCLVLPDEICWMSSSYLVRSFVVWVILLSKTSPQDWPKTTISS